MPTPTRASWIAALEEGLEPSAAARRSAARSAKRSAARSSAHSQAARYYGREATARLPHVAVEVESRESRPELKVVTRRLPARGVISAVILIAILLVAVGVVTPTLVGAAATGLESNTGRLERQEKELTASVSALSAQVSALSAPERVAEQAEDLGLGPAATVRYLELEEGVSAAGR